MKRWVQRLFLALVCVSASASAAESATAKHPAGTPPGFGDFPVASRSGAIRYATKIILTSPQARRYRTAITNAGKMAPDFAGHYRVAIWGCGTDCRGFAIVDLISGEAYTLPGAEYVSGVMGNAEERIDYRRDSRLFIITGAFDEKREGKYFYEWTGKALRLVFTGPVAKDDLSDAATRE